MRRLKRVFLYILAILDREQVLAFQGMYYVLFSIGGAVMFVLPSIHAAAGQAYLMLGPASYRGWTLIVTLCPPITLIGRRLAASAVGLQPGDENSAWGGAWYQFTGDLGVWSAINILAYELWRFDHQWWKENLFLSLFLLMGVLGGFMFTFRSVRRLVEVKRNARATQKAGL